VSGSPHLPSFAANLTMLYPERPFLERFEAAAGAGFRGVEFLFPYRWAASEIAARLQAHALEAVLFDLPAGDWEAGERGIACHPDRIDEFRASVETALSYARSIGCRRLNALAGIRPRGVDEAVAWGCLVANLRHAATRAAEESVTITVEPINTVDVPGYFVNRTEQALRLIEAVGMDNLGLQYDVYHAQVMEGDLARSLARGLGVLSHVQIADNPGRHQPGTGEIRFDFLFAELDRLGYRGWIGCEYRPLEGTGAGLDWARAYL